MCVLIQFTCQSLTKTNIFEVRLGHIHNTTISVTCISQNTSKSKQTVLSSFSYVPSATMLVWSHPSFSLLNIIRITNLKHFGIGTCHRCTLIFALGCCPCISFSEGNASFVVFTPDVNSVFLLLFIPQSLLPTFCINILSNRRG